MTRTAETLAEVPQNPAVYAMFGGNRPRGTWVAYVGMGGDLRGRLNQHFERRDSSVVTGQSAVGVNIDRVSHVDWWEHASFSDEDYRHAAELIAFEVLDPALRSRGRPRQKALELFNDSAFRTEMTQLFKSPAIGRFIPPRLSDLADELRGLKDRVRTLEEGLEQLRKSQPPT